MLIFLTSLTKQIEYAEQNQTIEYMYFIKATFFFKVLWEPSAVRSKYTSYKTMTTSIY